MSNKIKRNSCYIETVGIAGDGEGGPESLGYRVLCTTGHAVARMTDAHQEGQPFVSFELARPKTQYNAGITPHIYIKTDAVIAVTGAADFEC